MSNDNNATLEIKGRDGTRYFIPVSSVKSIAIIAAPLIINFVLVPEVWKAAGCKSFSFTVDNYKTIQKFLKDFRKNGGRCPVHYIH